MVPGGTGTEVLPRLSKDVFTTAPPWPQSARVPRTSGLVGEISVLANTRRNSARNLETKYYEVLKVQLGTET